MSKSKRRGLWWCFGLALLASLVLFCYPSDRGEDHDVRGLTPALPDPPPVKNFDPLLDELDIALASMRTGTLAFNAPEKLVLDEVSLIHLVLSPRIRDETVAALIEGDGKVVVAETRTAPTLEARLTGEAFSIVPITEARQPVSRVEPTEWRWQATPFRPGQHSMFLSVYAAVTVGGETHERLLKTYERELVVVVRFWEHPWAFLQYRPQWVLGGIGIGLLGLTGGWFFARASRRARANGGHWWPGAQVPASDVFISYSSRDRSWAEALAKNLRASGLDVWMDVGGIAPASFWAGQIAEALSRTKLMVLIGSAHAFTSHNVAKEVSLASEQGKAILPLVIDGSEVPADLSYQLAGLQIVSVDAAKVDEGVRTVLSVIGGLRPQTNTLPQ